MTARRLTITADPAACAAGLAMLAELSRAGRSDLDGAIAALAQVVDKGAVAPERRDTSSVKVHLANDGIERGYFIATVCGRTCGVPLRERGALTEGVIECDTPECNIIEVTIDVDLVTCARCQKAVAKKSAPR